jgi:ribosome biogenesis GTPase
MNLGMPLFRLRSGLGISEDEWISGIWRDKQRGTTKMNLCELGWSPFFEQSFGQYARQGLIPARVAQEHKNIYAVYSESGELGARVSGTLRYRAQSKVDLPTVGDWVVAEAREPEARATIHAILPRKSSFLRKVAWVKTEGQVAAANVDTVFIMTGLDRDFNLRRLERYLTLAWESGANPVIVLNKVDVCSAVDLCIEQAESISLGVPVHGTSALTGQGIEQIRQYIGQGRTVAVLGSSGVGKSTFINALLGTERLEVGSVRKKDGRGRHITTSRQLVVLPGGGLVIDTPGMRELQLWADEKSLTGSFEDIETLALECRFRDCQHKSEPECAVKQALEDGSLELDRFNSYLKLKKELKYLAVRKDQRARLDEKARWKKTAQWSRQREKQKHGRPG